jgi:hypothetical protein
MAIGGRAGERAVHAMRKGSRHVIASYPLLAGWNWDY